ncbi:hypothetical protein ACIRVF_11130 [Kitasatospora sp. NPDC101157]|uniref:hypothetical protein n=1 Tax=Kitasatospora sp. NPDC101157 TaxID=3364098 RepID=UPI00381B1B6F
MSETPQDPFAEIMNGIEEQFGQALFERRVVAAALAAEATGLVYRRAVSSGVPHDLAQAMAAEFWDAETAQAPGVEEPEGGDE